MYKYTGFGLNILSEMECPELVSASFETEDLTITLGNVPEKLEGDNVTVRAMSSISDDEFTIHIKGIARYYVGHGKTIVAEPVPGIDDRSVRVFLLGTVIAMALYQRRLIPMHASGIVKDDKLILFTGNSGAGKSTTLASFDKKGYTIFTDDICVLNPEGSAITGNASYPMMKLWADAITHLGEDNYSKDFNIRPKLAKYGQFFHNTFCTDALPVSKIFVLATENNAKELTIKKLQNMDAFKQLEAHAYKRHLITGNKLRMTYFQLLTKLSQQVEVYEITRPMGANTVVTLADTIETYF